MIRMIFVLSSIVLLGSYMFWGVLSETDNTKTLQSNQFIQILKQNSDSQLLSATFTEISGYLQSERFIEGKLLNSQGKKFDYKVSIHPEKHGKQLNELILEYKQSHPKFDYKQRGETGWFWIP